MIKTFNFLQELVETKILSSEGITPEEANSLAVDLLKLSSLLNLYIKDPNSIKNQIMDQIEKEAWDHGKPIN